MIVNGSFESPPLPQYEHVPGGATTITGWLTVDSGVERFNPSDPGVGFGGTPVGFAQTGTLAIDLAIFTGGGIQQTFGTLPGAWYRVEFYGGTLEGFNRDGTGQIEALVNSVPLTFFNVVNHSPTIVWSLFSFDFQATDSTTTLLFRNRQNDLRYFAFIDSVSVNAIGGNVGGSVTRMGPTMGRVICRNVTTRETVKIKIPAGVRTWDCEQAGLVVNPGDKIKQLMSVTGPAD